MKRKPYTTHTPDWLQCKNLTEARVGGDVEQLEPFMWLLTCVHWHNHLEKFFTNIYET